MNERYLVLIIFPSNFKIVEIFSLDKSNDLLVQEIINFLINTTLGSTEKSINYFAVFFSDS